MGDAPVSAGRMAMGKAVAAWLMVVSAMATTTSSPRDVVQAAVTRVVAVLQNDFQASPLDRPRTEMRRAEIRRIAAELFDFDEMARRTLTHHWNSRTPEEQTEFVRLFTDLLERSYVARIEQFSGERIIYSAPNVDGRYATVHSKIVTRRPAEIAVDYRLLLRDGRWRAYDVLVDGVSFVATRSEEHTSELQSRGHLVCRLLLEKKKKKKIKNSLRQTQE